MQLPFMGLGTFIGIEDKRIDDLSERHQIIVATILTALS